MQIPANQAVGHASQCNRLQGQNKKDPQSPHASPRRVLKGGKDTFTSPYSLFIAKELEGVKMKRDDVTSAKWKEMSPAEKYQDLANRNRSMKETLLQRMTAATAKWESMSYELKRPFIQEATRNKEKEEQQLKEYEDRLKEKARVVSERKKKAEEDKKKTVSFQQGVGGEGQGRHSLTGEELEQWTRQAAAKQAPREPSGSPAGSAAAGSGGDSNQLAQLALYLSEVGLVPKPVSPCLSSAAAATGKEGEGKAEGAQQGGASWDVASATDSAPSTPPSPTYGPAPTTKVMSEVDPASIQARLEGMLAYDSESDEEDEEDEEEEEIISQMVTGKSLD